MRESGWLTLDARRTILKNARDKASATERASLLERIGIPNDSLVDTASAHVRSLFTDPVQYFQDLGDMLRARGLLAIEEPPVAAPTRVPTVEDFKLPEPTFKTQDGRGVYSTEDVGTIVKSLLSHVTTLMSQHVDQRVEPIAGTLEEIETERARLKATGEATREFEDAKSWPRFKELIPRMQKLMREQRQRQNYGYTLRNAYESAYLWPLPRRVHPRFCC